jgi:nitrite reductase/ring-hydroxylating ferredoxin subunit/uncharacterized membrane protein
MTLAKLEHQAVDSIGQQESLDTIGKTLAQSLDTIYAAGGPLGQQVEDALHGKWLGHPLHPVLVEIPIGAWTVVQVLDLIEAMGGDRSLAPGADAALAVGLAGALGAAATGLTDWKDSDGETKRVGLVHGMINLGATALYGLSLLARRRNQRGAGRQLALLGYGLSMAGAYLGGDMVYRQRLGTNHAEALDAPRFRAVLAEAELAEGETRLVEVDDVPLMLTRQEGKIYALGNVCSHLGGPLNEGEIDACSVRCPWHGSRFALEDGKPLEGPSTYAQPAYETRVRAGQIELRRLENGSMG